MPTLVRRVTAILAVGVLFALSALPAAAQTDVVRELTASYEVQADGSVEVEWEIDWDFGETGRRGIIIGILVREPWELDDTQDAVYTVSDIQVSSPTGAPDQFSTSEVSEGEYRVVEVQIGDPNITLDEPRHTYQLSYTVEGALRTFDGQPEFYWDITSTDFPQIEQASITVEAPGGVTQARCLVADRECGSSVDDGVATYTTTQVGQGEPLTVVAGLEPGQVDNAEPNLQDARQDSPPTRPPSGLPGPWGWLWQSPLVAISVFGIIGVAIAGFAGNFIRRRDERYDGVPPGVMNPGGPTTKKKFSGPIPVRFQPPDASITEAGLALHGRYDPSHLAANIVQMAVNGTLQVTTDPLTIAKGERQESTDPTQSRIWHAAPPAGLRQVAGESMLNRLAGDVRQTQRSGGDPVVRSRQGGQPQRNVNFIVIVVFIIVAVAFFNLRDFRLFPIVFVAVAVLTISQVAMGLLNVFVKPPGASLTARGSAIKDQTLGFRQYIETAEAGQLNFEADQDIFARYLPWAVLFGLTERWTQVCEDLARMGRIQAIDYSFLGGSRSAHEFTRSVAMISRQTTSAHRAATRRASSSSFGGGSGGRSGFSSGSRGGGGGGGSSGRSW